MNGDGVVDGVFSVDCGCKVGLTEIECNNANVNKHGEMIRIYIEPGNVIIYRGVINNAVDVGIYPLFFGIDHFDIDDRLKNTELHLVMYGKNHRKIIADDWGIGLEFITRNPAGVRT
ncbi:MAG: hypothetical protein KAS32_21305 [Candidatus Peribacteraceae bacterium]|nr:hypothetical protein [Candidatus Peribacteraceae bacterium]